MTNAEISPTYNNHNSQHTSRMFKSRRQHAENRADDIVFYLSVGLVIGLSVGLAVASAIAPVIITLLPVKAAVGVLTSGITPAKIKITSTVICGVLGMLFGCFMSKQRSIKPANQPECLNRRM